jgi:hypothetical protein
MLVWTQHCAREKLFPITLSTREKVGSSSIVVLVVASYSLSS